MKIILLTTLLIVSLGIGIATADCLNDASTLRDKAEALQQYAINQGDDKEAHVIWRDIIKKLNKIIENADQNQCSSFYGRYCTNYIDSYKKLYGSVPDITCDQSGNLKK